MYIPQRPYHSCLRNEAMWTPTLPYLIALVQLLIVVVQLLIAVVQFLVAVVQSLIAVV